MPQGCCGVEVPRLVDANGIQPTHRRCRRNCRATMQTNINVQSPSKPLTGDRDYVYHAAFLDPIPPPNWIWTRSRNLVDLIEAHGSICRSLMGDSEW
ncbi:MAG: hypothetical protein R2873_35590 [Caldilineaceae bacterium]